MFYGLQPLCPLNFDLSPFKALARRHFRLLAWCAASAAALLLPWNPIAAQTRGLTGITLATTVAGQPVTTVTSGTVVTLTAGMTAMNRAKFIVATIIAGTLWATYAALIGYFGGRTFVGNHTLAFVVAFAVALSLTGLTELEHWLLRRRKERSEAMA